MQNEYQAQKSCRGDVHGMLNELEREPNMLAA